MVDHPIARVVNSDVCRDVADLSFIRGGRRSSVVAVFEPGDPET